jgi:hypothetical protein
MKVRELLANLNELLGRRQVRLTDAVGWRLPGGDYRLASSGSSLTELADGTPLLVLHRGDLADCMSLDTLLEILRDEEVSGDHRVACTEAPEVKDGPNYLFWPARLALIPVVGFRIGEDPVTTQIVALISKEESP